MKLSSDMSPSNVFGNKFQNFSYICRNSSNFFIKDSLYLYCKLTLSKVFSLVFFSTSFCFASFFLTSSSKSEFGSSPPASSPSPPASSPSPSAWPCASPSSSPDLNELPSFPSSLFSCSAFSSSSSSPFLPSLSFASKELSFSAPKLSKSPPISSPSLIASFDVSFF